MIGAGSDCGIFIFMGIVGRAQQVIASNFNTLLSKLEEPGRDLAQGLSDMKEQVLEAQRELIKLVGESKRLDAQAQSYATEIERWEKRAELAVKLGDDALAREALSQKRRLVEEQKRKVTLGGELRQIAVGMKSEITRMNQKVVEYGNRQNITVAQTTMARAGGGSEGLGQIGAVRPFDELRRIEEAIDTKSAEIEATAEIDQLLSTTSLGTMTREEVDVRFKALEAQSIEEKTVTETGNSEPTTSSSDVSSPKLRVRIEP
jgi:phage shock protein A